MYNFSDFWVSQRNLPNFSCHFWNHKVRVYSNFASLFIVMKDNSSAFFSWNLIYFGQKQPIKVKFLDFWVFCLHLDWSLSCEVYNAWSEKAHRSYLSWHWRIMQNLKKNWLVVWKITWGIWKIFIKALDSVKIGTFLGSFCPKCKMHKLKIYRGVMCNDTEEWWKIWRGVDLPQNWQKKFDQFCLENLKVSKI